MSETRKGAFTPEQEKLLDDLIELKGIGEALDGPAISLIDNQGIDRLLEKANEETRQVIYEVIDMVMEGIEAIIKK